MKKNYFLKYLLILMISITSSTLFGQDAISDQEQLIKQCLTFQPLNDKIPAEVKTEIGAYYILDHGIEFQLSSNFQVNGKKTTLISEGEINLGKPYFVFNILNIENGRALVEYKFIFTNKEIENSLSITVEFAEDNSEWKEYNYYIAN